MTRRCRALLGALLALGLLQAHPSTFALTVEEEPAQALGFLELLSPCLEGVCLGMDEDTAALFGKLVAWPQVQATPRCGANDWKYFTLTTKSEERINLAFRGYPMDSDKRYRVGSISRTFRLSQSEFLRISEQLATRLRLRPDPGNDGKWILESPLANVSLYSSHTEGQGSLSLVVDHPRYLRWLGAWPSCRGERPRSN